MSRRRSPDETEDALELFLDAMSNMFGGVVFIAVAVVVLLQFTTRAAAPTLSSAPGSEDASVMDVVEGGSLR